MTGDELKALDKDVKRLKRISSEWASQLHDLVEDKLPAGYEQIPGIAQSTYDACQAWAEANAKLSAAQAQKQEEELWLISPEPPEAARLTTPPLLPS